MSTNNPTSGQAQEDVKTASDTNVTHKLPSEVEQRFDAEYQPRFDCSGRSTHYEYCQGCDQVVIAGTDHVKQFFATEQVALLTRVLGLIKSKHMTMEAAHKSGSDAGAGYTIGVNSLLDKLEQEVQAIIKEYEV